MQYNPKLLIAISVLAIALSSALAIADHQPDHQDHHRGPEKHHDKGAILTTSFTSNKKYESICGGCHWAYIPQLLPSSSWNIILDSLNDHFGNQVQLTDQDLIEIKKYTEDNSANNTSLKIGRKILKHLAGQPPLRITDIPYIRHKHNDIPQATFARKSIQSLANCIACHPSASNAQFDDDSVRIPAQ